MNLGALLIAQGRSFTGYSEDLPAVGSNCFTSGKYARKHNPWSYSKRPRAFSNRPFSDFPSDFSSLHASFVIPNEDHNSHDGSIRRCRTCGLHHNLGDYAAWLNDITRSSSSPTMNPPPSDSSNHIPTIIYGPKKMLSQANTTTTSRTTTSASVEDMYALPPLNDAAAADPILNIWMPPPATPTRLHPPSARSSALRLRNQGLKYYTFTITYADNVAVVPATA